ncbi:HPF/RaiA family ribosome-associated protein [Amycolatopsis anabasis]|uniref:HPF/RaiA family ribosome-associated protein n=1 Tax=Amycolatopsis anabasis TaxID=1840409 RepID=UPI00131D0F4C|nr:HPF/RaiA family ribosome-associated protein [Amycolatopsis anabasis]
MAEASTDRPVDVQVQRGAGIPARAAEYAEGTLRTLAYHAPRPIRHATVTLMRMDGDQPITVHATLDIEGLPVRAHAVGDSIAEAVDLVREKLHGRLARLSDGMRLDYRPRLRVVTGEG